jgi:hypothetical protein
MIRLSDAAHSRLVHRLAGIVREEPLRLSAVAASRFRLEPRDVALERGAKKVTAWIALSRSGSNPRGGTRPSVPSAYREAFFDIEEICKWYLCC